jgi:membrane protease YdiL (CAAX protease family)
VVLVFPCLLVYELGVLALGLRQRNGVDLITDEIGARIGYGAFSLLLVAIFLCLLLQLRRSQRFEWSALVPILLESGVYALTMGTFIIFVMVKILHVNPRMVVAAGGPAPKIILALGAGVHEELFFRLLLLGGLAHLLSAAMGRRLGVLAAFVTSAALFSAAHHIPPYGDRFSMGVFTYRFLAGIIFGVLFWFRGLAVAVYTHALYDVYVMLLL